MKEKRNFGWWCIFILLFIWQLPQNIIAVLMLPFLGKLELIACRNYAFCFIGEKMQGGISLGSFVYVSKSLSKYETHIAHELDGHTVDSKYFGPLYLFIIGIPSICWAGLRNTKKHPNYYTFYTEKWANKHAKLKVIKRSNSYYDLEFE
jgi:hypothetical protein